MKPMSGKSGVKRLVWRVACAAIALCVIAGCGPTYPKSRFKESIVDICKREYHIDVKADVSGKTIAIYLPLPNLIDFTFSITKEAGDKINDVILSVSRVALSSDAEFDFYCVIAHDIRIPEIQIIIIKSVDDVKRLLLNDISRGEYSKRILIDLRLSPQSQKERSVKEVFQRMGLDDKWQEQVMNDFFRSEPAALGDIGYWNNRFYIKDITLPEFMAEQMTSRVKIAFKEEKDLSDGFTLRSAKGAYVSRPDKKYFKLEVLAEPKWFKEGQSAQLSATITKALLPIAAHVVHVYRFTDFDYVEILSQADGKLVRVKRDDLEKFRKKKLKFDDIMEGQQS